MKKFIVVAYKAAKQVKAMAYTRFTSVLARMALWLNGVSVKSGLNSAGLPIVHLSLNAHCNIGRNFTMGNWTRLNASGISARCKLEVRGNALLEIGENVGITATTIMCFKHIKIGNNVRIGVGTHIYDTDFHNIDPIARLNGDRIETVKTRPIFIGDNAFIGAYSIILKGVSIGENAVVGAGSVVTKNVPANEVWAGNPARCIKKIF